MNDIYIYGNNWKIFLLIGLFSILAGFTVLVYPMILVALIASVLLFAGTFVLMVAWRLYKQEKNDSKVYIRWL